MSLWIEHLKKWAAAHKITYMAAMKSPECKAAYTKVAKPSKRSKSPEPKR